MIETYTVVICKNPNPDSLDFSTMQKTITIAESNDQARRELQKRFLNILF